jgi:hypothetical protein
VFALQHGLEAFFHQLPPRPGDGRETGIQRRSDPAVTPGLPGWRRICLQQDARLRQLLRRMAMSMNFGPLVLMNSGPPPVVTSAEPG